MSPRKTGDHGSPARRARAKERMPAVPRRDPSDDALTDPELGAHDSLEPYELYRLEKARRVSGDIGIGELLEEARREYIALLAADAAKGKGGRPRRNAPKQAKGVDSEADDLDE